MPEKQTMQRARRDKRQGKAASTQAGEFVREEIHHVREGKHGARSAKQAIAIGLSKARRAGVRVKGKGKSKASNGNGRRGQSHAAGGRASTQRAQASRRALKREGRGAASHRALARQGRASASRRSGAGGVAGMRAAGASHLKEFRPR